MIAEIDGAMIYGGRKPFVDNYLFYDCVPLDIFGELYLFISDYTFK